MEEVYLLVLMRMNRPGRFSDLAHRPLGKTDSAMTANGMTTDQVKWAEQHFWFERSNEDDEGVFVIGRESFGSRVALVFYEFDKLTAWAANQRDFTAAMGLVQD